MKDFLRGRVPIRDSVTEKTQSGQPIQPYTQPFEYISNVTLVLCLLTTQCQQTKYLLITENNKNQPK